MRYLAAIIIVLLIIGVWAFRAHATSIECFGEHSAAGTFANVGDFSVSPGTLQAQSFVPSGNCTVTSVSVYGKKANSPTPNNYQVAIYSDSSGDPGSLIEQGSDITSFTGSVSWATSTFSSTTVLTSGTTYWVYMSSGTSGFDDTNFFKVSIGPGGTSVAKGKAPGGSWVDNMVDFTVYVTGSAATAATPTATSTVRINNGTVWINNGRLWQL